MPDRENAHDFLLALAGRVPDDGLAVLRTCLADGEDDEIASMLGEAISAGVLPLTPVEAAVASRLTGRTVDPELDEVPDPYFEFTPAAVSEENDGPAEEAARRVASRFDGCGAVWRAWRTEEEPPVRVFLIEVDAGTDLPELAAELQQWLAEAGEEPPRVEVFGPDSSLTPYHERALTGAALLWTSEAAGEVRIARVFDGAAPATGPFFVDGHPLLDDPERSRVLRYLNDAEPVLSTASTMDDIVEPGRGSVVPLSFRSDGRYVWPDTVAYYLAEYGLAPDPELMDHIRTTGDVPPELTRLGRHRVLTALTAPADEPAWEVGA